MDESRELPFKPISSTEPPHPSTLLDSSVPIKTSFRVISRFDDLIPQLAEEGGLHSCAATSVLNGLIGLNILTPADAASFQESFRADNHHFFGERVLSSGNRVKVLTVPIGKLLDKLEQNLDKEITGKVVDLANLSEQETRNFVLQRLTEGDLLVGGDAEHAVLVVGYSNAGDILEWVDPYKPNVVASGNTDEFVTAMKEGEPWLTVLSK